MAFQTDMPCKVALHGSDDPACRITASVLMQILRLALPCKPCKAILGNGKLKAMGNEKYRWVGELNVQRAKLNVHVSIRVPALDFLGQFEF